MIGKLKIYNMTVFGLTGGSGAGKSTAAEIFRSLGVYVVDADKVARQVVEKGSSCIAELQSEFGDEIIAPDGNLDRKKLGDIVFVDRDKLKSLNNITHKYIKKEILSILDKQKCEMVAIDGAVIIGSSIENVCAFIVSVLADAKVRIARIIERDGLSDVQAENRLQSQPTDDFYIQNSKYVIYNNGNEDELTLKINEVYAKIRENEV